MFNVKTTTSWYLSPDNEVAGRVMFSVVSVRQLVTLLHKSRGSRVTLSHDALDHTVHGTPYLPADMGLHCNGPLYHPASDIWWPSLQTCSNLLTWGPSRPVLTSGCYWNMYVRRELAVRNDLLKKTRGTSNDINPHWKTHPKYILKYEVKGTEFHLFKLPNRETSVRQKLNPRQ